MAVVKGFHVVDHLCRVCLGRILANGDMHKCSNCGLTTEHGYKAICCCGQKLRSGKLAGVQCMRNPNPTPEMPGEVVAVQSQ